MAKFDHEVLQTDRLKKLLMERSNRRNNLDRALLHFGKVFRCVIYTNKKTRVAEGLPSALKRDLGRKLQESKGSHNQNPRG